MNKLKTQKAITLVALVITIIVLLILAVVAIGAVRDSGIIGHAQNSADRYNTEKAKEESMLGQYEDEISKYETEEENNSPFISEKWAELNLEKQGVPVYVNYDVEYSNDTMTLLPNSYMPVTGVKIVIKRDGGLMYDIDDLPIVDYEYKMVEEVVTNEEGIAAPNFISFPLGSRLTENNNREWYYIAFDFKANNTADVYYNTNELIKSIDQEGITYAGTISVTE